MKVGASALLDGEGRVLTGTPASALGALFESLATLTVRVCAQTAEAATSHLRTERGEHEVDLIVERHDGHVLGIEVKLAASIDDKDVRHLHWLAQHHGPRVQDLIVLTTGPHAYRRPDGIAVVPLPSDSSAPEAGIFPVAGELDVERGATATGSARLI